MIPVVSSQVRAIGQRYLRTQGPAKAKARFIVGLGAGPIGVQELRRLLHEALAKVGFLH